MLLEKNPPKLGDHHGTYVDILFSTLHIISRTCLFKILTLDNGYLIPIHILIKVHRNAELTFKCNARSLDMVSSGKASHLLVIYGY